MKLLWIDATIRPPEYSRTYRLAKAFVDAVAERDGVEMHHVVLQQIGLSPLNAQTLALRENCAETGELDHPMFQLGRDFAAADLIVVAAPYWDLSFPAILKTYVEHISVANLTFSYQPDAAPLCRAKALVYLATSGGPMGEADEGSGYWKALCSQLYRIPQVEVVTAQCLDMYPQQAEEILSQAIDKAEKLAKIM